MSKPRLSIDEQIDHMKSKGISFTIISESDAKKFLSESNYYFKIKSYAKNYDKYKSTSKVGQYINLEFAYLQELSIIDAHLRKIILSMSIDIEHFAKVTLLHDFAKNTQEDGYQLILDFFQKYDFFEKNIKKHANPGSYCHDLYSKYSNDLAIWNIVELITFNDFLKLYHFYYKRTLGENGKWHSFLYSVKYIRNAAAHSNCLINSLARIYTRKIKPNKKLQNEIALITSSISKDARSNKMKNPVIHDFVAVIYLVNNMVLSEPVKKHYMKELQDVFEGRFVRNKEWFAKNEPVKQAYKFLKIIIDYYK